MPSTTGPLLSLPSQPVPSLPRQCSFCGGMQHSSACRHAPLWYTLKTYFMLYRYQKKGKGQRMGFEMVDTTIVTSPFSYLPLPRCVVDLYQHIRLFFRVVRPTRRSHGSVCCTSYVLSRKKMQRNVFKVSTPCIPVICNGTSAPCSVAV